jgi:HPt (histidine-containing phosphotransfer) domain-containing protein
MVIEMIDWTRVRALRDEIGAEDFDEVVALFLDEVGEAAGKLDSAPPGELPAALHFLKGSAMSIGFADFAALCGAGEKEAGPVDVVGLLDCLDQSRDRFLADLTAQVAPR